MEIHVVTLFPGMFRGPFDESIIARAQGAGILAIHTHDLRDFTTDRHHQADDAPYGGGAGMVLKPEPFFAAVDFLRAEIGSRLGKGPAAGMPILLPSARGRLFKQSIAQDLTNNQCILILCGHYEGVDARVESLATDCLSIGDYVLTGGELPAMVMVDAVARLLPGSLHDIEAAWDDSFGLKAGGLLQHPQYTRPAKYKNLEVPEVLLSGDHNAVLEWRRYQALKHTWVMRPDLLERAELTPLDQANLQALRQKHEPNNSEID